MDCKEFDGLLDDYMNMELPPALRAAFDEHADECHACERNRDEALTLRNRLRVEYAPPIPEGPDAFHRFKQELILKDERVAPKRRLSPMRGFGLAAVFCLLVGFLLINVPVSYSLPSGMRIVVNFDPPLTEAPEFEGLILPQDFYDALATDETLIESFTTVQDPDGLTSIEIEISSSDPEVAAKVYQALVTNYPALESGVVGYYGVEELKREPMRIMLREKGGTDEILSDDEINRIIIAKMPEIKIWVENEIRPLVNGIEININGIEDTIRNIEDIESQLDVKILRIQRGAESDKNGVIQRKFIIKSGGDDDLKRIDIFGLGSLGLGICDDMITDEDLELLKSGKLTEEELAESICGKLGGALILSICSEDSDDKAFDKLIDLYLLDEMDKGELREEAIELFMRESAPSGEIRMKIIKLDNGLLSIKDIPFGIDSDHQIKVKVNIDNIGDMIDGLELELDAVDEYLKQLDSGDLQPFLDEFMKDLDPAEVEDYKFLWKSEYLNGDDPDGIKWLDALRDWIKEHEGELGIAPPSFPLGEENGISVQVFTDADTEKLEVRVMSTDKDLDLASKGDDVISSVILTDEDRRQLKGDEISSDDFEQILFDRLNDLELLKHDFKISVSDDEASYKIHVENGIVTFIFTRNK